MPAKTFDVILYPQVAFKVLHVQAATPAAAIARAEELARAEIAALLQSGTLAIPLAGGAELAYQEPVDDIREAWVDPSGRPEGAPYRWTSGHWRKDSRS